MLRWPHLVKDCPESLHLLGKGERSLLGKHWLGSLNHPQHRLLGLLQLVVGHGSLRGGEGRGGEGRGGEEGAHIDTFAS